MPCVHYEDPRSEIDLLIKRRNENDLVNRLKGYFEKVYNVIESQEINIKGNKTYDLAVKNLFSGKADELSSDDWTNALCTATKSLPLDSLFKFRDSNRKTHVDVWDWFVTHCEWDELRLAEDLVEKKSVKIAKDAIYSMYSSPDLPNNLVNKVSMEALIKTIAEALESLINKDEVVRLSAADIKKYFK